MEKFIIVLAAIVIATLIFFGFGRGVYANNFYGD